MEMKFGKQKKIFTYVWNTLFVLLLLFEATSLIYGAYRTAILKETSMSTKVIYDFLHGYNPYNAEWLSDANAQPPIYYESGFFHLLPSVWLGKVFNLECYSAATIVHVLYVLGAMLLMYVCINKITENKTLGLMASAILFYCLNVTCYTNSRPDTLCSILILGIIYLIYVDACQEEYKKSCAKAVNGRYKLREWGVAFFVILLIFLKIHYASILFALFFVYLRRKRVWPMLMKGAILGAGMVAITQLCFPTFFSTFIVRVIEMFRFNTGYSTWGIMLDKWKHLFWRFPVILILLVIYFIQNRKKIFQQEFSLFLAINAAFNIIALCFMGKWPGNGIIYHEVMLLPTAIIVAAMFLQQLKVNGQKIEEQGTKKHTGYVIMFYVLSMLCILPIFVKNDIRFSFTNLPQQIERRNQEFAELDEYKSEHMLLSPAKSFYALANGIYQWDYGDQIYLPYDIGTSPRWNFLFPYTNQYRQRNIEYGEKMIAMIANQEYSLIITDTYNILGIKIGLEEGFQTAIEENYVQIKQEGGLTYWSPKEEEER